MTNKITKSDRFNEILTMIPADRDDLRDFINHELELLTKKNSSDKKPTKNQRENEVIKNDIILNLISDKQMTISEMMAADETLSSMTNQKIASLVRQLLLAGKVERIEDKRKAYFKAI